MFKNFDERPTTYFIIFIASIKKPMLKSKLLFTILICFPILIQAQLKTNPSVLKRAQKEMENEEKTIHEKLLKLSIQKGWNMVITGKNGKKALLVGVDSAGYPLYISTFSNAAAAATIKTSQLWPGGRTGLNLSGSSPNMKGKLAIWDGGRVRLTHVELVNRILQKDNPADVSDHSTHVAGTLMASGVNPAAKGMSFGLQQLLAYDFTSDVSEMFGEASNLLVSNHSYGTLAGWHFNETENRWEFYGEATATEDYKFGYYDNKAQLWDSIAYNAPYYLIVSAAGNSRSENGPAVGQPYWRYDASNTMINAGNRPEGISSNDGYDIVVGSATAKNILTIGAAGSISGGYSRPEDVVLSNFTGWGPTDDGRIKPDVVADGVNLLSPIATSDNAYATYSGTSMACPNAAGSIFLLQEYYSKLHSGEFMRAATLKGLVIHTADEAGPFPGPDYQSGFGLINMERAAGVITSQNTDQLIIENTLNNGAVFSLPVVASGKGTLTATISWTDPKAITDFANRLNNRTKKLVNDLDIVIKKGSTIYRPYTLNLSFPSSAAVAGDNITDNVEKIVINDVIPGESYTIEIKHKGTLQRGQQAYSLLVSGVGGKAYCSSAPSVNTGARIDSVALGSFNFTAGSGCTTYSNYTSNTATVEANQPLTLSIKVGSCDASVQNKVVKAFIDWNNDGDFDDAGENVAQSSVISGTAIFTTSITSPKNLPINYLTVLRIVVQETNNAADVKPCGSYTKGETQDYRVKFISPSNDVGISEIVSPDVSTCNNTAQLVTVSIKNFGATPQSNIPLSVVIKNGSNVIANLTATYPLIITGFSDGVYTFQSTVNLLAGITYTFTATTNLNTDQNNDNDQVTESVVVSGPTPPTGVAEICSANEAKLRATPSGTDVHFWYDSPVANNPIASGNNVTTPIIPANKTYYVAKNIRAKVGPETKLAYPSGGYNAFSGNYINFKNNIPVVIESVRLYIGNPGKITLTVADIISIDATSGSYSYRPISSIVLNVYPTTPNPQPGAVNGNNVADTGAVFYLNLPVQTAGDHAIIVQCSEGATIFRNSSVSPNPYPFTIPGVFSITGNSATLATDPNYYQNFYYFFYAMTIKTPGCESPRVPVVASNAIAPVLSIAGNILTSSTTSANQWYRDNVIIPGVTGATYTAVDPGVYKVVNVDAFGCTLTSNEVSVVVTAVVDVNGVEIGLKLSPNPNKGRFTLDFEVKGKGDLSISLINASGQKVFNNTYPGFTGRFTKQLNVGRPGSGVYTLRIDHNKKTFVKKIIIQ